MSLIFSGLNAYTNELIQPLLTSAVTGAKTQQMILDNGIVLTGVKGPTALPVMETDAVFASQSCSFDPSGTTTFSQVVMTPGKIKVEEKICPKDLTTYFTAQALRSGSTTEDFGNADFLAAYLGKKNDRIAAQLETAIWQSDSASATANLNKFNGIQKIIAAGSPINANVSGYTGVATITTITGSNVVAATEGIYKAIPAAVMAKGDVKIWVGYDWYRLLILAYRALNLFSYNPQDVNAQSFILPGTNIEIVPVNGLNGTGDAYAISLSNMAIGVDLESDQSSYKFWFSEDNNDCRFRAEFCVGTQIGFTTETVSFLAAI
jgi:hypothetical protein